MCWDHHAETWDVPWPESCMWDIGVPVRLFQDFVCCPHPHPPPQEVWLHWCLWIKNQHSITIKCQETWLKAIRLKEVFDFHDFFKKNKSGKIRQRPIKPFISLKQYILTAFISYPLISLASLNDWSQVTDLVLVWLFTWKYPLNWL